MHLCDTQGTSCLLRWLRNIDDELHALIAGKKVLHKVLNELLLDFLMAQLFILSSL